MTLCEPSEYGSDDHELRSTALGFGRPRAVFVGPGFGIVGSGAHADNTKRDKPEPVPRRKLRRVKDISAPDYPECWLLGLRAPLPRVEDLHFTRLGEPIQIG
ncbi:MAG: hypothetical protein ABI053_09680 [Lacisediminihabitans sp.]